MNKYLNSFYYRITRKCGLKVHSLLSHLYTMYSEEGYSSVKNYYSGNDITTKDVLFFPVNYNKHWSMFVVKDPQYLRSVLNEDMMPTCSPSFLFFDSCQENCYHSFETVGRNIIKYLLHEMKETNQLGKVDDILHKYGYTPSGMYKYVFSYIHQYLLLLTFMLQLVSQQENNYDCGVFVCQFAYGMIRLINTAKIKRTTRIDDIKQLFHKTLCSKKEKSYLRRMKKELKRNDFLLKKEYASQWRIQCIKLICGLSILQTPLPPPKSHVGLNNPKNMCFAIATIQCFLRCTSIMHKIVSVENKERDVFSKLLFNTLVEIQSAKYIKSLPTDYMQKDNKKHDKDEEDKTNHVYGEFPEDYKTDENNDCVDMICMDEYRDGEPHGKL